MELPNEILMLIFDLFAPVVVIHPETCGSIPSEIFGLRSTCRRFRALVNELPFWFDPNFKVVEVIPPRQQWSTDLDWEGYDAGFLRLIFQDRHLVQCLARRTRWHFKNLQTLRVVIDCVPSFSLGATFVGFYYGEYAQAMHAQAIDWQSSSINDSVRQLTVCQSLTSLIIHFLQDVTLDLTLIAASCPSLKWLHLLYIENCEGTLAGLHSLEYLYVSDCVPFPRVGYLVPVDSSMSLTHLALTFAYDEFWLDDTFRNGALDGFANLKSLYAHPLSDGMCDFLLRTTIELNELRTTVVKQHGIANLLKIISMLSKPSLCHLRSMCLAIEDHVDWRASYQSIAESIVRSLTGIEEMVLGMGMDVSWWPMFTNLRNLKRLIWYVPGEDCRVTYDHEGDIVSDLNIDHLAKEARLYEIIESTFDEASQKPSVKVKIYQHGRYHCVCSCDALPCLYDHYLHHGAPSVYEFIGNARF
jgi:hypothetical protein